MTQTEGAAVAKGALPLSKLASTRADLDGVHTRNRVRVPKSGSSDENADYVKDC